jgi:hypothetical protein
VIPQAGFAIANPTLVGIPTFLGARIADIEQLEPNWIAMVGLFLDHGCSTSFGARFAARQIRYASAEYAAPLAAETLARCVDLGDLNVFPLEPDRQAAALKRQIGAIVATGAIPVVVGGRPLGSLLGAYSGLEQTVTLGKDVDFGSEAMRAALQIDLNDALCWKAPPGAFRRVVDAVSRLPAHRIGAVHLTGVAPALDIDGRRAAAFAVGMLDATVRMLAGCRPCR